MKFMLIMNSPRDGYAQYVSWPKKVLEANIAFMQEFSRKLREAGELVSTAGLASPVQAKLVRAGKDGKPITDGVFPESKEFLAGYWIVDVDSPERGYEIAAEASTAPGDTIRSASGEPVEHFRIEVREVMSGPPEHSE
ncbi:MAG: YciI family protein [Myxococcota bacterium]